MLELHKDVLSTMQDVRGLKHHLNYQEADNEFAWQEWKRRRTIQESNPEVVDEGDALGGEDTPKSESLSSTDRLSRPKAAEAPRAS